MSMMLGGKRGAFSACKSRASRLWDLIRTRQCSNLQPYDQKSLKLFAGLSKPVDLRLVSRLEFGSGAVAMRYEPRR